MFHVAFLTKSLVYIEFRVFRKKKKNWRCKKGPEKQLAICRFELRQRFSLSRQIFLTLCRDMVHRLQRVAGSRQSFFLLVFCRDRGPHCVVTVFYSLS